MLKLESDQFVCACNSVCHQLIVQGDNWGDSNTDPFVAVSIHLTQAPVRYRIWYAIRYVLGLDHKNFSAFDEVILEPDQARELVRAIEKHLEKSHDHASDSGTNP
jgi:hypothetical protein